jgi:dihydrolipoamide dehydrogenase
VIEETKQLQKAGIDFSGPIINLDRLRASKDQVIRKLTEGLSVLAKKRKVTVIHGTGYFASKHRIIVEGSKQDKAIQFDHAIIATGSVATNIPGLPEDERIMDSTRALELIDIPKSLLVIGGGIVGLELACIYQALGSHITIVELRDQLMLETDADLIKPLQARLRNTCDAIYLNTKVAGIDPQPEHLKVSFEGPEAPDSENFDRILVAVGRSPHLAPLQIQTAGISATSSGFISTDNQQRTNIPHIFAIGDAVGPPMLAHKATHEGKVAAEVAAGCDSVFHARVIPSVAYTDPEIAWVGLTEKTAIERRIAYKKSIFPWTASGRALSVGRSEGFTKLLFDPETNKVLGAGIVGISAGDLISELCLAIEMGCESEDISLTIHPHPTLSETIAFSAEAYQGTITDLYVPTKK